MTDDPELQGVVRLVSRYVTAGVQVAMEGHPNPALVIHTAPSVLARLAGSQVLQLVRTGVINDGEAEKMISEMAVQMRLHADPSLNAPHGGEVSRSWGARFRAMIKGKPAA